MEIKIGLQNVARELTVETEATAAEVEAAVRVGIADGGVIELSGEKGRRVLVSAAAVAYIDLGSERKPHVGFGQI